MWGWGLFGVASWLVAPVLRDSRLGRAASFALVANGPVSIAGALLTVLAPGWVMTAPGMVAFVLWNVLVFVMAALALAAMPAPRNPRAAST